MERERNVFFNLVRGENSFTELFTNIFQFTVFQKFFKNYLSSKFGFTIPALDFEDFSTQNRTDKNCIPDIIIDNVKAIIIIENKVGLTTGLTNNQPEGYLDLISDDRYNGRERILLFIIPKDYRFEMNLKQRAKKYLKDCLVEIKFETIHWDDLIHEFNKTGLGEVNPILNHFSQFASNWFPTINVTFSKSEIEMILDKTVIETMSKLMAIVDNVSKRLPSNGGISHDLNINKNEYAVYIRDSEDNGILYFGIWYPFWREHNYPFALAVDEKNYPLKYAKLFKERFPNYIRDNQNESEDWLIAGIDINLFASEVIADKVFSIVTEVLDYLMD